MNTRISRKVASLVLFAIILLSAGLRLYGLGKTPVGPDWDEAAIGYNAYSLLKTGRDEYGKLFPLVFRSFNDYKPPLYIYLAVPSVALFGLNIWSVRLVSAVAGIAAVLGTYFLTRELLMFWADRVEFMGVGKTRNRYAGDTAGMNKQIAIIVPFIAAFFLALSPWHIFFSRVAFEANLAVTLNIWGIYSFLRGLKNARFFYIAGILFVLGIYSYHTERVFIPMLTVLLSVVFLTWEKIRKDEILLPLSLALLLCIPIFISLLNSEAYKRLESTSIFRKRTEFLLASVQKYNWDKEHGSLLGMVLNDRRFEWGKVIAAGYLSHFSPKWLFATGDQQRHHAPDTGLLYLFSAPFVFIGLVALFSRFREIRGFVLGWLAISPLAAALTFEVPHAVRSIVFLPVYEILIALGIGTAYQAVSNIYLRRSTAVKSLTVVIVVIVTVFSTFETVRHLDLYFNHMNAEYSEYWQYGYKEAADYVLSHESSYERVVVSSDLEQPYMFMLFFLKYPPDKYLAEGGSEGKSFGIFTFRKIDWSMEKIDGKTLYVDTPLNAPKPNLRLITFLNGKPSMAICDTKPL